MRGAADTVLTGGRVDLGAAVPGPAGWVAVSGGRISAVGPGDPPDDLIDGRTRVVDIRGGTVLPGFQDAHVHPLHGGMAALTCELHDLWDADAYVATIGEYARSHPDLSWITGSGWAMQAFPGGTPRRETLDVIVPDRPVFLVNRDGHGAWANSKALDLAGIARETPDPPDGRIERDPDGTPTGSLHEGAMDLVGSLAPPPSSRDMEEALLLAQRRLHSLGITAWQDAWVEPADQAAYVALASRDELTARVVLALWWDRGRGLEQVPELIERRAAAAVGGVLGTTVKIMQDGVCENYTAAMLRHYTQVDGTPTVNSGLSMVEPRLLREAVTRLDAEGFQVHFHAIGDRAVREALDACEAARSANGPTDGRHHIAHIQFVHPADVPRFGALGVVANAQPFWACHEPQMDELTIPFVGEAAAWQYPFRDLLQAGATLAFGSDWPVSTPDPMSEMEVAVRRVAPDDREAEPFLPDQRLDLRTALDAFTRGSAFVNHLDDISGSIEVGKWADLAVVDRDLFEAGGGPGAGAAGGPGAGAWYLGDAKVILTMVGGEVVFADDRLG
jgi:predicted amidohydrolase YtcJ